MSKDFDNLKTKADIFFSKSESLIPSHPWIVPIVMHEYFRNIFPDDPNIPYPKEKSHSERIFDVLENLIKLLESVKMNIGSYKVNLNLNEPNETKLDTGKVYGSFWQELNNEEMHKGSIKYLEERWKNFEWYDSNFLEGKNVIDVGCGSGRYSLALSKMGAKSVLGVDYGLDGIEVGKKLIKDLKIENISFQQVDILNLPFSENSFDFVFCNGVLHHTTNLEKGLSEIIRICKKGSPIWLYLYASGGIYWYSRKVMNKLMKKIPQSYTKLINDAIGVPKTRWIFPDNWYVPIERHCTDNELRELFKKNNIKKIDRLKKGRSTDLEYSANNLGKEGKNIWGEGELRYFIFK